MLPARLRCLYPFRSNVLDLGGLGYHFVDEGKGDPILCVHGNPTWSFYYRNLIMRFRDRYRVVAPDHIGCGLSDKPQEYPYVLAQHIDNLEKLVLDLDLRGITLVVHDWGGPVGFGVAVRHPERFRRLVILNTIAFPAQHMPWLLAACRIPWLGEFLIRGLNAFAALAMVLAVRRPPPPEVRAGYLYPYNSWNNRIANHRFVLDIPADVRHPSYARLAEVAAGLGRLRDLPAMIVWGERDWVFVPSFVEQWLERFPGARVHRLRHAHHLVLEDAPEALDQLESFLKQKEPV
ncbi:MAG: alpha/beta fold hydrolase [Armatimonadetes bacterium]|nr:alpha/beta fold hydrolase [Armatimonadota bacterium]